MNENGPIEVRAGNEDVNNQEDRNNRQNGNKYLSDSNDVRPIVQNNSKNNSYQYSTL